MKTIVILICTLILCSCQKEVSLLNDTTNATITFKQFITADRKFHLAEFYSDIPIDFNTSDTIVEKQTNLWGYVSGYLKDDEYIFNEDGTIQVIQNIEKHPGDNSPILFRNYTITTVENKVMFDYLDYNYEPFQYFLYEKGTDHFILYTFRDKARLFSKFTLVQ